MMLFSEYLTEHTDLYDNIALDDATKAEIEDWYEDRQVCDDDYFGKFFRRVLSRYLDRYNALIRVDLTEIDPLVSTYRERQLIRTGSTTHSGTDTDTTTYSGSFQRITQEGGSDSSNTTRTPNLTTKRTPDLETVKTPNITTKREPNLETVTSPDLTQTTTPNTQTETTTTYGRTEHTEGSSTETPDTTETTEGGNTKSTTGVGKTMPQSIAYEGATAGEIPSLDWQYPSTQQQAGEKGTNTSTTTHTGTNSTEGSSDATTGGSDTATTKETGSTATTQTGTNTTRATGTDTTTQTGTDTTTEKGTDTTTQTGTETTAGTNTYGKTITTTETPRDKTETRTSEAGKSEETSGTDREIWTGRDGLTPQEALMKMRDYIRASNAFDYLLGKIEPCFFGIYEI